MPLVHAGVFRKVLWMTGVESGGARQDVAGRARTDGADEF